MKAQIRIGHEWVIPPRYGIGDAVVNVVDTANEPQSLWYDDLSHKPRFFWWYRGIVVGVELDYYTRFAGMQFAWVYRIRVTQGHDSSCCALNWDSDPLLLMEDEIKPSRYTARCFGSTLANHCDHALKAA